MFKDTMTAWIPLVWFQQIHQPFGKYSVQCLLFASCCTDNVYQVTAGNRGAAVVAGLNVIVFTLIAVLAHREKMQKKRNGELRATVSPSDSVVGSVDDNGEKRISIRDEEDF